MANILAALETTNNFNLIHYHPCIKSRKKTMRIQEYGVLYKKKSIIYVQDFTQIKQQN